MKRLTTAALVSFAAACSGPTPSTEEGTTSDALRMKAFEYECSSPGATILSPSLRVAFADGALRLTDDDGPNFGTRDRQYRAPKGTSRARYDGLEFGGDCELRLVVDTLALTGGAKPALRVQCSTDDSFEQDVYACKNPRAVTENTPAPAPKPPPHPGPSPDARTFTCTGSSSAMLGRSLEMTIDAKAIKLQSDGEDFAREGTRNPAFKAKNGARRIQYKNFEHGDDCELTTVLDETALEPATKTIELDVRCAGDDFQQDRYRCAAN
jgi:hypothetical protein